MIVYYIIVMQPSSFTNMFTMPRDQRSGIVGKHASVSPLSFCLKYKHTSYILRDWIIVHLDPLRYLFELIPYYKLVALMYFIQGKSLLAFKSILDGDKDFCIIHESKFVFIQSAQNYYSLLFQCNDKINRKILCRPFLEICIHVLLKFSMQTGIKHVICLEHIIWNIKSKVLNWISTNFNKKVVACKTIDYFYIRDSSDVYALTSNHTLKTGRKRQRSLELAVWSTLKRKIRKRYNSHHSYNYFLIGTP